LEALDVTPGSSLSYRRLELIGCTVKVYGKDDPGLTIDDWA